MTIQELAIHLESKGCRLRGCSDKDLLAVEDFFGITLPLAYRDFLLNMGNGAGTFMLGSSVFYDEIFNLKEWAVELLEEDHFKPLPEEVFVCWMHQGYQFAFFYPNQGDDPLVYFYYENKTKENFEKVTESFTDFLQQLLDLDGLDK
jgi:hypothetical protein